MASEIIASLTSPTSDALTFSGLSLSGYRIITLRVDGLTVGTDNAQPSLQVSQGGSWLTGASDYAFWNDSRSTSGSTENQGSAGFTGIRLTDAASNWGVGNASGEVFCVRIELINLETGLPRQFNLSGVHVGPTGNSVMVNGSGEVNNSTDIDGLRIVLDTGTMTAGRAVLIGHS